MGSVFLLSGKGDIGKAILREFKKRYNVIAPTHDELDLENINVIDKYFEKHNPDVNVLIHCVDYNQPKLFEELSIEDIEKTNAINCVLSGGISKKFQPLGKLFSE